MKWFFIWWHGITYFSTGSSAGETSSKSCMATYWRVTLGWKVKLSQPLHRSLCPACGQQSNDRFRLVSGEDWERWEDTSDHISSWKPCSHLSCTPTHAGKTSVVKWSSCCLMRLFALLSAELILCFILHGVTDFERKVKSEQVKCCAFLFLFWLVTSSWVGWFPAWWFDLRLGSARYSTLLALTKCNFPFCSWSQDCMDRAIFPTFAI